MPDPLNTPVLSPNPANPAWLLTPGQLRAIHADDHLLEQLARGEAPDPTDRLGWVLLAWLREVEDVRTADGSAVTR